MLRLISRLGGVLTVWMCVKRAMLTNQVSTSRASLLFPTASKANEKAMNDQKPINRIPHLVQDIKGKKHKREG